MKKIKVGIVGYGNLGKAIEEEILKNKNLKLVAIFSRRTVSSKYNTLIEPYHAFKEYKNKIDVMMMCGGSANDIELQVSEISKYFCLINSFDTHSKLKNFVSTLDILNKENKTISISACGWDPGLFSIIRALSYAISTEKPLTFWGKGLSMGHSDAIRGISGVEDGLQFTIPNKKAILDAKKGMLSDGEPLHFRECFVFAKKDKHKLIEKQIKNIPNYFKGQPTSVSFVSSIRLAKLKSNMAHEGIIISPFRLSNNKKAYIEFQAKMDSNPIFTAKIMIRFIFAIIKLKDKKEFGAYLPFDVPISYLFLDGERQFVIKHLC